MRLKKEKKEKDRQTRDMRDPSRRQLSNVRVVQKNLVYILGLGVKHASVDVSNNSLSLLVKNLAYTKQLVNLPYSSFK